MKLNTKSKSTISPNSVASRLVNVSNCIKLNKREIRNMKRKLHKQLKSALTSKIQSVYKRTYIKSPVELCGSIFFLAELCQAVEAGKLDVK
jgi:hypothetical protein